MDSRLSRSPSIFKLDLLLQVADPTARGACSPVASIVLSSAFSAINVRLSIICIFSGEDGAKEKVEDVENAGES